MRSISNKNRFVLQQSTFETSKTAYSYEASLIGVQPLWLKDGRRIITTLLHVSDCHVVRVTTRFDYFFRKKNSPYLEENKVFFGCRDKYLESYMGEKDGRPCYTGPGRAKVWKFLLDKIRCGVKPLGYSFTVSPFHKVSLSSGLEVYVHLIGRSIQVVVRIKLVKIIHIQG